MLLLYIFWILINLFLLSNYEFSNFVSNLFEDSFKKNRTGYRKSKTQSQNFVDPGFSKTLVLVKSRI